MRIGIIGPPQSGKTTIFNAAAGRTETVGDYSKASHRAVVKVPDARLDHICRTIHPKKITYAEIEYIDSCAISGRAKEGDTAAVEMPDDLRYAETLMIVVDCFSPDAAPEKQLALVTEEMLLADQIVVERNLDKRERTAKLTGDQEMMREAELLKKCLAHLEQARPLALADLDDGEQKLLKNYAFLSLKPVLIVLNIAEGDLGREQAWLDRFSAGTIPGAREVIAVCGKIEMELAALSDDDRSIFLEELGIEHPAMERLIQKSYALLGLISFFTCGEPEGRAWTIKKGTNARKAAGVVHSDMERGFIRAEVTAFDDFKTMGSVQAVKEGGRLRVEGKDYIVADGDIFLFRFNI